MALMTHCVHVVSTLQPLITAFLLRWPLLSTSKAPAFDHPFADANTQAVICQYIHMPHFIEVSLYGLKPSNWTHATINHVSRWMLVPVT
jgi:hypothetical protein